MTDPDPWNNWNGSPFDQSDPFADPAPPPPAPAPAPTSTAGRLAGFYRSLTPVKKFVAALLVVAGAIGTVSGAVSAINGVVTWISDSRKEPGQLARTQELGIEVWQGDKKQDMFTVADAPGYNYSRVDLAGAPFEIRFAPDYARSGLRVVAWTDDSVFHLVADQAPDYDGANAVYYPGKGMADTEASSSQLILTNEAFIYLQGTRVAPLSATQSAAYFNTVSLPSDPSPSGHPFSDYRGRTLYVSVWVDRDGDGVLDNGEFDYIQLMF